MTTTNTLIPENTRPQRVRRSREDARLVRRIVEKRDSMGGSVGSLAAPLCQCCGGLAPLDRLREFTRAASQARRCDLCEHFGREARGRRFCELCARDCGSGSVELIGEICTHCARGVGPLAVSRAIEKAARRRFVDAYCGTREDLLRLDAILEEERFHEETQRDDAEAVRRGYERFVREVWRGKRELGLAWTAPLAPDPEAPVISRRIDVLVARAHRAGTDIFVRNALLALPRQRYGEWIDELRRCPDWWPTHVVTTGPATAAARRLFETFKVTDRLGRSIYAVYRLPRLVGGRAQPRELWNLFTTKWAAGVATAKHEDAQREPARIDERRHEDAALPQVLH